MYPDSVAFNMYPEGAASCHLSFTLAALKITIGGTTIPPALMYVTTVLVLPLSLAMVWKARSPFTPITFCDLGTSWTPLSSMFQILLGRNSIFHLRTHWTNSSKNFSICKGLAPIALAADMFCEFFLHRLGFLLRYPHNHFLPAIFFVGEKPFLLVFTANSYAR